MMSLPQYQHRDGATMGLARPPVVELVGPAAAGKTSVLHALSQFDDTLRTERHPPRHRHMSQVLPLMPTFLALHWPYQGLLWKEMKRITFLRTLQVMLQERPSPGTSGVVVDEGAVYMLARMRVYGGDRAHSAALMRWWDGAVAQWAEILGLIVWLDGPDALLIHRLRTRDQMHRMQALSDEVVAGFLASYRTAYNLLLDRFGSLGVRILRVRVDLLTVPEIVEQVTAEIRRTRTGTLD
jgi:hypothetical protein